MKRRLTARGKDKSPYRVRRREEHSSTRSRRTRSPSLQSMSRGTRRRDYYVQSSPDRASHDEYNGRPSRSNLRSRRRRSLRSALWRYERSQSPRPRYDRNQSRSPERRIDRAPGTRLEHPEYRHEYSLHAVSKAKPEMQPLPRELGSLFSAMGLSNRGREAPLPQELESFFSAMGLSNRGREARLSILEAEEPDWPGPALHEAPKKSITGTNVTPLGIRGARAWEDYIPLDSSPLFMPSIRPPAEMTLGTRDARSTAGYTSLNQSRSVMPLALSLVAPPKRSRRKKSRRKKKSGYHASHRYSTGTNREPLRAKNPHYTASRAGRSSGVRAGLPPTSGFSVARSPSQIPYTAQHALVPHLPGPIAPAPADTLFHNLQMVVTPGPIDADLVVYVGARRLQNSRFGLAALFLDKFPWGYHVLGSMTEGNHKTIPAAEITACRIAAELLPPDKTILVRPLSGGLFDNENPETCEDFTRHLNDLKTSVAVRFRPVVLQTTHPGFLGQEDEYQDKLNQVLDEVVWKRGQGHIVFKDARSLIIDGLPRPLAAWKSFEKAV
ncbi:hypothetical protein BCR43DRAFT_487401 [Syncephalastrum racemosum]|uniref:Uncharacterized protein n=1 Tax=Syncephalastrum racemosum TaxID=13706 RepID=A0A1X2HQQ1_SYNRA|nr:hypothetical protein BCR43DRAFT_487401 [Syncephalastrum racemosum]